MRRAPRPLPSAVAACLLLGLVPVPGRAAPAAHPSSVSYSRLHVSGSQARLDLRFQTKSLLENLPDLDADGDGLFTEDELAASRDAVGAYLLERWWLEPPPFDGGRVPARLESLDFARDLKDLDQTFQWIEAKVVFDGASRLDDLVVHSQLFTERDPYHRDFLQLWYESEPVWNVYFDAGEHTWRFRSATRRRPGVLGRFLLLGVTGAARAWELGVVLLGIAVVARRRRDAVHGALLLLAAAAAGTLWSSLVPLAPSGRLVGLALPLAAAYVGAESLVRRTARLPRTEALVFGLVLGLGLPARFAHALSVEPLAATAWTGLSLGLAATVLAAVVLLQLLVRLLPGARAVDAAGERGASARWVLRGGSCAVAALGLAGFLHAAGWLGS